MAGETDLSVTDGTTATNVQIGGQNVNVVVLTGAPETIYGASSNNVLYGFGNNDTLYGGSYVDYLFGGDGTDTLVGGAGADFLHGGAGADTFTFASSSESAASVAANTTVTFDDITDFKANSNNDAINLDAVGSIDFAANATATVTAVTVNNVANFSALEAAIETEIGGQMVASTSSAAQVYNVALTGTGLAAAGVEQLLIVNDGDNAISASDLMIELSGTSASEILTANFDFTA